MDEFAIKKLGRDLVSAGATGDVEEIRRLIAEGADVNYESMQGHTALIKVKNVS